MAGLETVSKQSPVLPHGSVDCGDIWEVVDSSVLVAVLSGDGDEVGSEGSDVTSDVFGEV